MKTVFLSLLVMGLLAACSPNPLPQPGGQEFINYTLDNTSFTMGINQGDSIDGRTVAITQGLTTQISGVSKHTPPIKRIDFTLTSQSIATGIFPAGTIKVQAHLSGNLVSNASRVTITNFPQAVNQYYEGSFIINFTDSLQAYHEVTGSFKVKREQ